MYLRPSSLILANNGFKAHDIALTQVAAVSHDSLTPAGGDTTKGVDQAAFDEDKNYADLFKNLPADQRRDWQQIMTKWNLSEEKLAEIVQGKGVLGRVLDIADKISYVANDVHQYLNMSILPDTVVAQPDFQKIESLASRKDAVCGLWSDVVVDGEQVYFSSPERLADFLVLRGLMFRNLYQNPQARTARHVLLSATTQALYRTGKVNSAEFINLIDDHLVKNIGTELWGEGEADFRDLASDKLPIRREECYTKVQAIDIMRELGKENLIVVEHWAGTSDGSKLLTKGSDGKIAPVREVLPELKAELDSIFSYTNDYNVMAVPFAAIGAKPEAEKMLRGEQQQMLAEFTKFTQEEAESIRKATTNIEELLRTDLNTNFFKLTVRQDASLVLLEMFLDFNLRKIRCNYPEDELKAVEAGEQVRAILKPFRAKETRKTATLAGLDRALEELKFALHNLL